MKYIIQGTYGSLKYFAKFGNYQGDPYHTWQGLKDNATVFTQLWAANEKLGTIRHRSPKFIVEIIEYHEKANTAPDPEKEMV